MYYDKWLDIYVEYGFIPDSIMRTLCMIAHSQIYKEEV